jgi:RNA polymerase sigma factor (sigma-70 family)
MSDAPPPSSALESVVQKFARMVLSIGRRAGLDEADLDELIQGVRVRLWRSHGERWSDADVSATYVHRAAQSTAIDIVRARRGPMARATDPIADNAPISDGAMLPSVALEQQEATDRILAVIATLAPDRKAAVTLHLSGYSRDEISAMLGWKGARTRNLIQRGMDDLRDKLTALGLAPKGGG